MKEQKTKAELLRSLKEGQSLTLIGGTCATETHPWKDKPRKIIKRQSNLRDGIPELTYKINA